MQRIFSGSGTTGSSSTSSNLRSALAPLAAAASSPSALAAIAARRLGQRDESRADRSTMPPSTTKPNLAAPAWRKLTNRMGRPCQTKASLSSDSLSPSGHLPQSGGARKETLASLGMEQVL